MRGAETNDYFRVAQGIAEDAFPVLSGINAAGIEEGDVAGIVLRQVDNLLSQLPNELFDISSLIHAGVADKGNERHALENLNSGFKHRTLTPGSPDRRVRYHP